MSASDTFGICSKCSVGKIVSDMGQYFCAECGVSAGRVCDTSYTAYSQSHAILKSTYSRKNRFEKKLLASLRCLVNYVVDEKLLDFLRQKDIATPPDLLKKISDYLMPRGTRRPYIFVMYYWRALGKEVPILTERDLFCLKVDFDEIYFAWERQNFQPPMFPYAFLLRQIVLHGGKRYSVGMHKIIQFVRTLRCPRRSERYNSLFHKCVNFSYEKLI